MSFHNDVTYESSILYVCISGYIAFHFFFFLFNVENYMTVILITMIIAYGDGNFSSKDTCTDNYYIVLKNLKIHYIFNDSCDVYLLEISSNTSSLYISCSSLYHYWYTVLHLFFQLNFSFEVCMNVSFLQGIDMNFYF